MTTHLMKFIVYYLLYRRHGSLKRELGVKTPFEAVEKWYELKPELFLENPTQFKNKVVLLQHQIIPKLPKCFFFITLPAFFGAIC